MRAVKPANQLAIWVWRAAKLVASACMSRTFYVEMDSKSGPFMDERLFIPSEDIHALELDFILNASSVKGVLQAVDLETDRVIWQKDVEESAIFTQALGPLEKDRAYAVRFTCSESERLQLTVSSRSDAVQEQTRSSQKLVHAA